MKDGSFGYNFNLVEFDFRRLNITPMSKWMIHPMIGFLSLKALNSLPSKTLVYDKRQKGYHGKNVQVRGLKESK